MLLLAGWRNAEPAEQSGVFKTPADPARLAQ